MRTGRIVRAGAGVCRCERKDLQGDEGKRQRWKTFLHNHLGEAVGIDLFTIPTATFKVLFGFVIISHLRRRIFTSASPTTRPPISPNSP